MVVKTGSSAPIRFATVTGRYPRLTRYSPNPPIVGPTPSSSRMPQPLTDDPSHRKFPSSGCPPNMFSSTLKRNRKITAPLNPYNIVDHGSIALLDEVFPSML